MKHPPLVPIITANAMNNDLVIIKKHKNGLTYEYINSNQSKNSYKRPLFLLRQGGKYSALAYKTGTYDTDAGKSEEYQNSECSYDKMSVYTEGFCKYLSLSTYMSSDSDTKENDVCKNNMGTVEIFQGKS